ncbi:MAG TPA: helix-turn-helix transcriptional regulator [Patescibacteria group bacterium]|nr:helix-turn-helix transcriptional regulator [Patescibacteria group bacterium]
MLDRTQLGKRIKEARLRTGMSQQELANVVGVSDKTISAYEVGRVDPPLESLEKLSQATSHPIAYFIGDVQSNIEAKLERIARELAEIKQSLQSTSTQTSTTSSTPQVSQAPLDQSVPQE